MPLELIVAFFVTAVLYSSVGFGGGSTYSAILLETALPAPMIPLVSLPCNIVVSGTGFIRMVRRGAVPGRTIAAIVLLSVPAAFAGGITPVSRTVFLTLLSVILLYAGIMGIFQGIRRERGTSKASTAATVSIPATIPGGEIVQGVRPPMQIIIAGALIGYVSGIVGIGGGILLSPILQREGTIPPRQISAVSAGFIFLNSLAALSGKYLAFIASPDGLADLRQGLLLVAFLIPTVLLGGYIGSTVAVRGLTPGRLRILTGVLLVVVALRALF